MSKVLRGFKNVTKGYSTAQVKVRHATSNDPQGPSGSEMSEIAQMTFNSSNEFYDIMDMLEKRLNDEGKNWRHVFKSLKVLDYVLHEGSGLVVTWAQKNIHLINVLREFRYIDRYGSDHSRNVRDAAEQLVDFILDDERIWRERSDRRSWKSSITRTEELQMKTKPSVMPQDQRAQRRDEEDDELASEGLDITPKMSATYITRGHEPAWPSDNDAEVADEYRRAAEADHQHEDQFEKGDRESRTRESREEDHEKVWKGLNEALPQVPRDPGGDMSPPDESRKVPKQPINPDLTLFHGQIGDSKPDHQITGTEPPIAGISKENDHLPVATPNDPRRIEVAPTIYLSDVPLGLQTTAFTEPATPIFTTTEVKLGDYFKDGKDPPDCFTDMQCGDIARLLIQSGKDSWSAAPRIYIVLRLIGQLQHFDAFLDHGINDLWLPFSPSSLPSSLSLAYHEEFLKRQTLVLTKAINLENGSRGHAHFTRNDPFPFEAKETLGEGGFGYVDKIVSPLSGRAFARKRFRRARGQKKTELESFMNELKILKRLHHIHCVSLVASYTDPKYFGIIIAPVADCDLAAFYPTVTPETTPILRSFFGCLANAMNFLHSAKIRHRDIKPQNILVKGSSVYLTDFGISLDWENLSRSTTTKDTAKSMLYCAPEVARYEKRNTSADIWSLGCVFLEMLTVIKCKTLEEQRSLFKEQSGNYRFYDNISAIRDWTAQLRRLEPEGGPDSLMSDVILEMLQETADDRILAAILSNKISKYQTSDSTKINPICGDCCNADTFSISDSGSDKDPFEDTS